MDETLRLLIIEDNPVIAADIHRIIEAGYPATAAYARSFTEAVTIIERLTAFDLAVVNPPVNMDASRGAMQRLAQSTAAIVVCSAAPVSLDGTPLEAAEFLLKPFYDDELLAACQRALERAGR